jgi:hypothetical protein
VPAGSNAYNSLWQVRTDAWSALEESTAQLALAGAHLRPVEQLTDAVAGVLDVLAPIERFWAFPGMQAFYRVRWLFATGKYDRCASMVARVTIYIGNTGIEGDAFKRSHLMDRYGVQINKTSRNGPAPASAAADAIPPTSPSAR